MRRVCLVLVVAGVASATGCLWKQSKKYDFTQPKVEEFNPPPNEARYNNPPEDKYRRPPVSKDLARESGGAGGPMMMNGPGGLGPGR